MSEKRKKELINRYKEVKNEMNGIAYELKDCYKVDVEKDEL